MKIEPFQNSPGAMITDLPDNLASLNIGQKDAIVRAYDEYGVLVFRGRAISIEEQMAVCSVLGTMIDQAGNGEYWFNITNKDGGYDGKLCFHADFSNAPALLTGASLYGAVLPNGPTATVFAHTGRALESLPASLQSRIAGARSVHSGMMNTPEAPESPVRHARHLSVEPRAEHPLEFVHPKTGKRFLFVSDLQSEWISGVPDEESLTLLDELTAWVQQPQFVYRHQWQRNDLVVWDQVMMQHSRSAESVSGERTLRRVSFTYPGWAGRCQEFFSSMGTAGGRSGTQETVL